MMTTKTYPLSRQNDIVVQELNSEILIYDLKANKAYCLNEASSLVWQACDGKSSVSEIGKQLSEKLKSPISEEFVFYTLENLKENDLLTHGMRTPAALEGLSRREVIRRIGFGSLAALPLVISLVAPTAANAASGEVVGFGDPCTGTAGTQGSCASGQVCCQSAIGLPGLTCNHPDDCDTL